MLGEGSFKEIEGQPVRIRGFEELELFLHHPYGLVGQGELFVISEAKTGMSVSGWAINPEVAKQRALETLELAGLEKVREVVAKRLEEEAHRSPRCAV